MSGSRPTAARRAATAAVRQAPQEPETVGLYVHLPWCVRKCPYCDFNSHALGGELPEGAYLAALLADLDQDIERHFHGEPPVVASIFLGGGTPSLFSPTVIEALLRGIARRVRVGPDAEITLEANPGTVEQSRFTGFREAGVNRLSLGIQSFEDAKLEALGRIHDGAQCRSAIEAARAAGFDRLNLDLMFALPGQTPVQAARDLDTALGFEPEHLSHYQLTLEPNTLFHARPPVLPDEDSAWEMQRSAGERLSQAGFCRYEISAWARPGSQCAHNLNYWRFGDYLGIGAGAHAKLTRGGGVLRTAKQRQPAAFLREARGPGRIQQARSLGPDDLVLEFMLNRLRLVEGWSWADFAAATGLPPDAVAAPLTRAREAGLMDFDGALWRGTDHGRRFLNDLLELFLPGSADEAGKRPGRALAGGAGLT